MHLKSQEMHIESHDPAFAGYVRDRPRGRTGAV